MKTKVSAILSLVALQGCGSSRTDESAYEPRGDGSKKLKELMHDSHDLLDILSPIFHGMVHLNFNRFNKQVDGRMQGKELLVTSPVETTPQVQLDEDRIDPKQPVTLVTWLCLMLLIYVITFEVGQVNGLHHEFRSTLAKKGNSMLLFVLLSISVYYGGKLHTRFTSIRRFVYFNIIVFISAQLMTVMQVCAGSDKSITPSSILNWPIKIWVLAAVIVTALTTGIYQHLRMLTSQQRQMMIFPSIMVAVGFLAITKLSGTADHPLHVHHWFLGVVFALFFQKVDIPISFIAQAIFVGVFLHGGAVWGFDSMFRDLQP